MVPFEKQGRVFGFAASVESAAAPISAFLIGPLAQFWLIPYMNSQAGQDSLGWLLGPGEARGIALAFLGASAVLLIVVLVAFISKPYRELSAAYAAAPPSLHTDEEGGADASADAADPDSGAGDRAAREVGEGETDGEREQQSQDEAEVVRARP